MSTFAYPLSFLDFVSRRAVLIGNNGCEEWQWRCEQIPQSWKSIIRWPRRSPQRKSQLGQFGYRGCICWAQVQQNPRWDWIPRGGQAAEETGRPFERCSVDRESESQNRASRGPWKWVAMHLECRQRRAGRSVELVNGAGGPAKGGCGRCDLSTWYQLLAWMDRRRSQSDAAVVDAAEELQRTARALTSQSRRGENDRKFFYRWCSWLRRGPSMQWAESERGVEVETIQLLCCTSPKK